MSNTITFLHSGGMSNIVASLASIYQLCRKEDKQAILYLDISKSHGLECNGKRLNELIYKKTNGKGICQFDESKFDFLKPLIEYQPYIQSLRVWTPDITLDQIDYNLNEIHHILAKRKLYSLMTEKVGCNLMYLHQIVCELNPAWNGPWLEIPNSDMPLEEMTKKFEEDKARKKQELEEMQKRQRMMAMQPNQQQFPYSSPPSSSYQQKDKIDNEKENIEENQRDRGVDPSGKKTLICRTFKGQSANSFFLSQKNGMEERGLFMGYDFEYRAFCEAYGISMERREVSDAMEAADVIYKMKRLIVNDSVFLWIALGLGFSEIFHEISVDEPRSTKFYDCPNLKYLIGSKFETFDENANQIENQTHHPAITSPKQQFDPSLPRFKQRGEFDVTNPKTWPNEYQRQFK